MKKFISKLSAFIPALALVVGIFAANSACSTYYHQPKVPDEMNIYRK